MKPKSLLAVILAAVIAVFCPAVSADDFSDAKQKISRLSDQYDQLEDQQKLIEAQIGKAGTQRERELAAIQQLDGQIETITAQMELLSERIALLELYVERAEARVAGQQRRIDESYEAFKKRLNAMVKLPRISPLSIALGTDSYHDFVDSQKIMERLAAYDKKLLEDLNRDKAALEAAQRDIEKSRDDVKADKALLNEKRQVLGYRLAESRRQIQDIALLEQQVMANQEALRRQMEQVQAEMDRIYDQIARKSNMTEYVGGEKVLGSMMRPAPTLDQITSPYGLRFGNSNFHTGMDFSKAGAYGQEIVAAIGGKVAFVNTAYTPGYGYGKYVILDHGGGITTLYAHCSEILAQPGQMVAKGEVIAKVGSTGWSTGPHCHFEVRVNGTHTNPVPYLEQ